jgi:hypothetical protein
MMAAIVFGSDEARAQLRRDLMEYTGRDPDVGKPWNAPKHYLPGSWETETLVDCEVATPVDLTVKAGP